MAVTAPLVVSYADLGLRPSTRSLCPRSLAGRHCKAWNPPCPCQHPALDHLNAWTDRNGRPVLTAEPYSADGEELAELIGDLVALGLRVTVDGRSPYYPGATTLLLIQRDIQPAAADRNRP